MTHTHSVIDLLVDVCSGWEVHGVAADVLLVRVLVYTDIVNLHGGGEGQMVKVDEAEVSRHSQVGNEVLVASFNQMNLEVNTMGVP